MGAGCSFCGAVVGKSSYDLQVQRSQTNGGNLPAREDVSTRTLEQEKLKQDQPFVTQTSERSENPGSTNKEIVSHSQCDVTFNTGSPHVLDFDVEKSRTTANDEELNQNSTLACPSESQTNELVKRERLVADEDFKPGHVTREENTPKEQTAGHAKTLRNDEQLNVLSQASDEEIQAVVDKCWKDIKDTCISQHHRKPPQSIDSTKGWRVVRLFVSSTFTDYHAEREVLVKKVCCLIMQNMLVMHEHFESLSF